MTHQVEEPRRATDAGEERQGPKVWVKRALIAVACVVVLAQVIPLDRSNPPVAATPTWDSPRTQALFERACGDCHSHQTRWPWYAYVAPASWLVVYDVHEGRGEFNVSAADVGEADEAAEELEEGAMPPWQYLVLHPEAELSAEERAALVAGLEATFGREREGGGHEGHHHGDDDD